MDFDLTEEQSMLKDSLNRLLADTYGFEQRRRHMAAPEGWSGEMWGRYAEMGLMALPFDEADGGLGGSTVETMIVMEAMGNGRWCWSPISRPWCWAEPCFALRRQRGPARRIRAAGRRRHAETGAGPHGAPFALRSAPGRDDRNARMATAGSCRVPSRWCFHGDSADRIFVTARTAGGTRDEGGIGIFLGGRQGGRPVAARLRHAGRPARRRDQARPGAGLGR